MAKFFEAFRDINGNWRVRENLPLGPDSGRGRHGADLGNARIEIVEQGHAGHLNPIRWHMLGVDRRLHRIDRKDAIRAGRLLGRFQDRSGKSGNRLDSAP